MTATVMVVDDDVDIREIVTEVLGDAGYAVVTARNGAEALELLETTTPGLILLDLNMPVMDGVEFCRRRAGVSPRAPIVVMSAMHQLHERIAELEVDGALPKPVELSTLLEIVGRHCKKKMS